MSKKLKVKLPKRIAGVKIPKVVRKGPIAEFLNSSAGQLILAETLVIIGRSFAVDRTDPNTPAGEAARHPIDTLRGAANTATGRVDASKVLERNSARIAFAFNEAVRAFRTALEQPVPASTPRRSEAIDAEVTKKKPASPPDPQASH